MNSEKEKQHYVPKFYLKQFSFENNKKQLGVFNTNSKFFTNQAKLKTQAYKSFFYGHDGIIENKLSKTEDQISPIISKIINTKKIPAYNTREYTQLLIFIILTQLRNPAFSNLIAKDRDELVKRIKEIAPNNTTFENKIPEIPKNIAI